MTAYLLDTNVVSESSKRRPDANVLTFLRNAESSDLFLSVLTIGELRKGVARRRSIDAIGAASLSAWVDEVEFSFASRLLAISAPIARIWGQLSAQRSLPVIDTLMAATAIHHGMTFVTRNITDVAGLPLTVLNPWKD